MEELKKRNEENRKRKEQKKALQNLDATEHDLATRKNLEQAGLL